ncbi:Lactonohydrolase oryL [Psilocybe cubensis]|uniref:Lactonohydrolase oryL n=2 Tax=Psilocybe cubensis TaxID=181762 RepID=A0ACB8GLL8_PSICU|nr:Lactonohydrolase oryL [Psilocybe cubensis]KAH9476484.1 Lactonohydrolase oryL [Psilocybe cubensis]
MPVSHSFIKSVVAAVAIAKLAVALPTVPSQGVVVDLNSYAVLGPSGSFKNSASGLFNPTSTTAPFFQIFDDRFLDVIGENPIFRVVSSDTSVLSYAREAPVYVASTDELFFAGFDPTDNVVSKISLAAIETAIAGSPGSSPLNVAGTRLSLSSSLQVVNGGTGPYNGKIVFVTLGSPLAPPALALVDSTPPYATTVLLDNFFSRPFNSINDVKIHPTSGKIFFTDPSVGNQVGLRPAPLLKNNVYRFDPDTGDIRAVASDLQAPNGIAFSHDGRHAYVSDTGAFVSLTELDPTRAATIYKYDLEHESQAFTNRRVFAYADTGIPDGLQLDASENLYVGAGDGVHVYANDGTLIGKFFTGTTVANMVFAGNGRLLLLGGADLYYVKIAANPIKISYP